MYSLVDALMSLVVLVAVGTAIYLTCFTPESKKPNIHKMVKGTASIGLGLIGLLFILGGGAYLFHQIAFYLDKGYWSPFSVIDALLYANPNDPWLNYPTTDIGVYKILSSLPFSGSCIASGLFILFIRSAIVNQDKYPVFY